MCQTESKVCTKCGQPKPDSEYNKNKKGKNGLNSQCKSCCKEYADLHRDKDGHAANERNRRLKMIAGNPNYYKELYQKFGAKDNEHRKLRYSNDLDYRSKKLFKDKKYTESGRRNELYLLNREVLINRSRLYKSKNPEKIKTYGRQYREDLSVGYISAMLNGRKNIIPSCEIPNKIIEQKRITILIKRELKKQKL